MKEYKIEHHVHASLSPCADLGVPPGKIVKLSLKVGLYFIGTCNHNSAENVSSIMEVAELESPGVIHGTEMTSPEEVHLLELFDLRASDLAFQDVIYARLPDLTDEIHCRNQPVDNADHVVTHFCHRLLQDVTGFTFEEIVNIFHEMNGLLNGPHVDKETFDIISQINFMPEGLPLDAMECCHLENRTFLPCTFPNIHISDTHSPGEIGIRHARFHMEELSLSELNLAIRSISNRKIIN